MDGLPNDTDWYLEYIAPELIQAEAVRRVLYEGKTKYQHVRVLETVPFGRSLVLDGKTQSSEADEWVYHEGLVQPVMVAHTSPNRVFIAGGGEGATAREVLRHTNVTDVVMVDLDKEVVDLCREHLPNHHRGSFEDSRLTLLHEDALAYLDNADELFDVMIIDVPDPLEGGPAYLLYTEEFYGMAKRRLADGGMVVTQAGPAGPTNVTEVFAAIIKTMSRVFPAVTGYRTYVPSFGTMWGFAVGATEGSTDMMTLAADEIDRLIAARISSKLAYYDGVTHQGLMGLPKYIRQAIADESRIITKSNPIYAI